MTDENVKLINTRSDDASANANKKRLQASRVSMEADWWKFIDNCMHRAIKNYELLTTNNIGG